PAETAAQDDLAVFLDGNGLRSVLSAARRQIHRCVRVEGNVWSAVNVEPGDAFDRAAIDVGEIASDEHFAVGLHRHGLEGEAGGLGGFDIQYRTEGWIS